MKALQKKAGLLDKIKAKRRGKAVSRFHKKDNKRTDSALEKARQKHYKAYAAAGNSADNPVSRAYGKKRDVAAMREHQKNKLTSLFQGR